MAVILLTAALIACRKWVEVCISHYLWWAEGRHEESFDSSSGFCSSCCPRCVYLTSKCTLAGARDEGNVLPSTKERLGLDMKVDSKEGGFHTQLCYPSPGWVWPSHCIFLRVFFLLISKWIKYTDLKCFETYLDQIISKTIVRLTW